MRLNQPGSKDGRNTTRHKNTEQEQGHGGWDWESVLFNRRVNVEINIWEQVLIFFFCFSCLHGWAAVGQIGEAAFFYRKWAILWREKVGGSVIAMEGTAIGGAKSNVRYLFPVPLHPSYFTFINLLSPSSLQPSQRLAVSDMGLNHTKPTHWEFDRMSSCFSSPTQSSSLDTTFRTTRCMHVGTLQPGWNQPRRDKNGRRKFRI